MKLNRKTSNLDERQECRLLEIEGKGFRIAFWGLLLVFLIEMTVTDDLSAFIGDFTIKELYVRTGDAWKILLRRLLSALCVAGIFYVPAIINQMITIQKLTNINPSLNERAYGLELLIIYIGSAAFLSAYPAFRMAAKKSSCRTE